jgi:hypothetical protein
MSSKYLQKVSLPNEAINVRVNDLTVDGSYSGPSGSIPDPLVVNNLFATVGADINELKYASQYTSYGTITQVGTSDVVLNSQTGLITTSSAVIAPEQAYLVGLQNNLIGANTLCKVWLHNYSGTVSATAGIISVSGITQPGQCSIQIINAAAPGGAGQNLNGTFKIGFELIQLST